MDGWRRAKTKIGGRKERIVVSRVSTCQIWVSGNRSVEVATSVIVNCHGKIIIHQTHLRKADIPQSKASILARFDG